MHRRLRRTTALLSAAVLATALAACGDSDSDAAKDDTGSESSPASGEGSLAEVTFSGEVGDGISAEWAESVALPEETTTTTLVAGDGEEVAEGDTVMVYLWVGNGTSQKELYSDYDNGAPEAIPFEPTQVAEAFTALFEGQTYGSRVAVVADPTALFGDQVEGNSLGIGAEDSVVVVGDLIEKQATSPEPTDDKAHDADPSTQPSVVEEGGAPTGLDFSGIEEPELDTPVQRVVLEEGDGAAVKDSDTVVVNYLGSTYDADAPFDESFSRGEPLTSPLSGLIPGWTIGLTGVKVGSRVLLQIPPAYGYGAAGSGTSIPGNSTLWFLIDVVEVQ
ncbi:FKBP-type peptidyl-prolyl cis-trans isomerase [Nocardioides sambongensis]|uniref:FKBP-type peptidyl-prolyl cis-trans isomerase n=1 Tax=Nocardioides sambongensis TaxID=2589074 RepID=UPI00112D3C5C|nr:FKBP-type peptidyl-prolyl cis-trans isomerase [Nocardioides sambongensis]